MVLPACACTVQGMLIVLLSLALLALFVTPFVGAVFIVKQNTVAVVTTFGKYTRVARTGLNIKIPFVQKVQSRISVQNRSMELQFQAITQDQANVYFKAMLLFSVANDAEETIKSVAFKFIDQESLFTALVKTVEAITRGFVATKKQSEILGLRNEIVKETKNNLDETLSDWGYHLVDLQLNDITFDEVITTSMAKVVASQNLQRAAEFEGAATYIRITKEAAANGEAIKIEAAAEAEASQRRGEGVRMFRREVAQGLAQATQALTDSGANENILMFAMWTETIRDAAAQGKGNVIFLDGSVDGMQDSLRKLMAFNQAAGNREQSAS